MVSRVFTSSVVAVALMVALVQQPANAQGTQPIVRVTDIVVDSVEVVAGQLIATADVTLNVLGRVINVPDVEIPLTPIDATPGEICPILHLEVGPIHLDVLGLVVNLDDCEGGPVILNIDADPAGGLLGDLLCAIGRDLLGGIDLGDILDDLTDEELEDLTDELTDFLNDLFDDLLGALAVGGAPVAHQAGNGPHACDILSLELGPLDLDVLGLVVTTSRICLDIHAERGGGNLLGNLLCSLAGLLDGPANANALQAHVRNILRLLDRLGL